MVGNKDKKDQIKKYGMEKSTVPIWPAADLDGLYIKVRP